MPKPKESNDDFMRRMRRPISDRDRAEAYALRWSEADARPWVVIERKDCDGEFGAYTIFSEFNNFEGQDLGFGVVVKIVSAAGDSSHGGKGA